MGSDLLAEAADLDLLVARLRRAEQGRPLAEVLQNQALVAGIGNLWASEALWHAGLAPTLSVEAATDGELRGTLDWARTAMRRAVAESRPPLQVYRRTGRKCARCGALIVSRGIGEANRTAYWCPACQRDS